MFIELNDRSYIATSQIARYKYADGRLEICSHDGIRYKTDVSNVRALDAMEIISNKFIEVLDKDENVAIIPFDTITAIRKLKKPNSSKNICAVKTISGEVFFISEELFLIFKSFTMSSCEFGEVP